MRKCNILHVVFLFLTIKLELNLYKTICDLDDLAHDLHNICKDEDKYKKFASHNLKNIQPIQLTGQTLVFHHIIQDLIIKRLENKLKINKEFYGMYLGLNHPNIAKTYFGIKIIYKDGSSSLWIVCENLNFRFLESYNFEMSNIQHICRDVCNALIYLHKNVKIGHGSLKLDDVMGLRNNKTVNFNINDQLYAFIEDLRKAQFDDKYTKIEIVTPYFPEYSIQIISDYIEVTSKIHLENINVQSLGYYRNCDQEIMELLNLSGVKSHKKDCKQTNCTDNYSLRVYVSLISFSKSEHVYYVNIMVFKDIYIATLKKVIPNSLVITLDEYKNDIITLMICIDNNIYNKNDKTKQTFIMDTKVCRSNDYTVSHNEIIIENIIDISHLNRGNLKIIINDARMNFKILNLGKMTEITALNVCSNAITSEDNKKFFYDSHDIDLPFVLKDIWGLGIFAFALMISGSTCNLIQIIETQNKDIKQILTFLKEQNIPKYSTLITFIERCMINELQASLTIETLLSEDYFLIE
ncbi:hypothetical protein COBT_000663 [Conglomerata obtusa]